MPEDGENILKYSPGDKSLKAVFIIYADLECLLKKDQSCKIIQKILTHRDSLSLICSFDETKQTQIL